MTSSRARKKKTSSAGDNGPTHILKMKPIDRDESGWSQVGVAWEKSNGCFTVRLNRGTVLDWHDFTGGGADFALILVPAD